MTRRCAALEGVDDDHAAAATGAWLGECGFIGLGGLCIIGTASSQRVAAIGLVPHPRERRGSMSPDPPDPYPRRHGRCPESGQKFAVAASVAMGRKETYPLYRAPVARVG